MTSLLVRDLPEDIHRALKRRASRHARSLQKEVHHILANATQDDTAPDLPALNLRISDTNVRGPVDRSEIYRVDGQ